MTAELPSLREQKRAATRTALESAALDLVLSHGPEATTVEAIAARAGVSARTFFNYFESKDAAILGVLPREHDRGLLEQLRAGAPYRDTAQALVQLVMRLTGAHQSDGAALARRREVLRRHPEVLASQADQLSTRADTLIETMAEVLGTDPAFDEPRLHIDQASMLVMMAAVAVRRAVEAWALIVTAADDAAPIEEFVEQHAVALMRATARSLT